MDIVNKRTFTSPNFIAGLLLLGLSVWIAQQTRAFPSLDDGSPGPALFPQLIALCLGGAGIYLIFRRDQSAPRRTSKPRYSVKKRVISIAKLSAGLALACAYPLLIEYTHFIPLMAGLILLAGLLLNNTFSHSLLMAVLSAALIFSLFSMLLKVPL